MQPFKICDTGYYGQANKRRRNWYGNIYGLAGFGDEGQVQKGILGWT